MSKNLVIVESPAKCKTIKKYLGKDYEVMASYGHVRDLIPKEGAVDTEHDFAMKYQLIERNSKHVDTIVKAMKKSDTLFSRLTRIAKARPSPGTCTSCCKQRKAAQGQGRIPCRVPRNHQARGQRGAGTRTRPVDRAGQCATGAACARLPGRFQSVAVAMEEDAPRPLGRPGTKPGPAHDRRARRSKSRISSRASTGRWKAT